MVTKKYGENMFQWAHTIKWRGKKYYLAARQITRKTKADKVAQELRVQGFEVKVVKPWSGFGLVYLVYTNPQKK